MQQAGMPTVQAADAELNLHHFVLHPLKLPYMSSRQCAAELKSALGAVCSEPACPQCRMQMQSRRDCKRDSRFDRLMQQLYGDLQGFEAQVEPELTICSSLRCMAGHQTSLPRRTLGHD